MKPQEKEEAIDKSSWPPGEWHDEPDRVEWRTKAGYPALVLRAHHGNLCGYVAVPPGHPSHGADVSARDDLEVHGGVTYGAACAGEICHIPAPGEPDDVWWIGFDTIHAGDYQPKDFERYEQLGLHEYNRRPYRNLAYVKNECEHLAEQLHAQTHPLDAPSEQYRPCRTNFTHARPCGPTGIDTVCACGCEADDVFCQ